MGIIAVARDGVIHELDRPYVHLKFRDMNTTQRNTVRRWIRTLRSGTYPQGMGRLKSNTGYCCLGVLCDTALPGTFTYEHGEWKYVVDGISSLVSFPAHRWTSVTGFPLEIHGILMWMNDDARLSFDEIADMLDILLVDPEMVKHV